MSRNVKVTSHSVENDKEYEEWQVGRNPNSSGIYARDIPGWGTPVYARFRDNVWLQFCNDVEEAFRQSIPSLIQNQSGSGWKKIRGQKYV